MAVRPEVDTTHDTGDAQKAREHAPSRHILRIQLPQLPQKRVLPRRPTAALFPAFGFGGRRPPGLGGGALRGDGVSFLPVCLRR